MVAHFFITLRLSFPLDCTLNITKNYPKVWWNCSKLFIKVCLCLNNKPISGVKEGAGFFPLFPVLLCDWGYWDYSASQYTHMSSLGFECLPLTVTVILFTSDFRDCLHCSKKKVSFTIGDEWKTPLQHFWSGGGEAAQLTSSVIVCLVFHLHIKKRI